MNARTPIAPKSENAKLQLSNKNIYVSTAISAHATRTIAPILNTGSNLRPALRSHSWIR